MAGSPLKRARREAAAKGLPPPKLTVAEARKKAAATNRRNHALQQRWKVDIPRDRLLHILLAEATRPGDLAADSTARTAACREIRQILGFTAATMLGTEPDRPIEVRDVSLTPLELARRIAFALQQAADQASKEGGK